MFTKIEGDVAVYRRKGVYKQGDLYEWNGRLFIKDGNGFIGITKDGRTTVPDVFVETVYYEGELYADRLGRIHLVPGEGRTRMFVSEEGAFIESSSNKKLKSE